jgi:hypothetical protein
MERRAKQADVLVLNRVLIEQFIASHALAPEELVLDIDTSEIPLHGDSPGIGFCWTRIWAKLSAERVSHAKEERDEH